MTRNHSVHAQSKRKEIGNLIIEGIPDIPPTLVTRLKQYQNTRDAAFSSWLPKGDGILMTTRFGETAQFHIIERAKGLRKQITFFEEPVGSGRICPNAKANGFVFSKDIGGNEFYQLYYYDFKTTKSRLLTDGNSKNSNGVWSTKGDQLAYSSTKRNSKDYDVYLVNPEYPEETKLVMKGKGYWTVLDWSPNDRYLTLSKYVSINESYVYILDVKTGDLKLVHENEKEEISYIGGIWNKKGDGIYLSSDYEAEFKRLKYYDLKKNTFTSLTPNIDWNISDISLSGNGKQLAFTTNENGVKKLYLLDTKKNKYQQISNIPLGQISDLNWHPDNNLLGLTLNTPQRPSDVYVLDIKKKVINRWTDSEVGGLDTSKFVVPNLIAYPTFDKVEGKTRKIPAFYYKPKKAKGPLPVLIYIHGGPEGQFKPMFYPTFQFYANEMGIAVIAPNVRGSVGYGKSYVQLDNAYKREDSVKDIGCLLDWIKRQSALDETRVAVIGGSYGGYMVLASMSHFNDRLKCGIDVVGISNFVTFLKNTKSYRRDLRRVEYGDERDPKMKAFLNKISPTNNAHKIDRPVFIVQGLNDPRVPVSESEQMLKKIRSNGGKAWYLLAKDEGHGFRKKSNRDVYMQSVILFLNQFLLDNRSF